MQNVPTILGMNSSEFAALMGCFTPNLLEGWKKEEFLVNLGLLMHIGKDAADDFLKRAKKNYRIDASDKMKYSKLFLRIYADDVSFSKKYVMHFETLKFAYQFLKNSRNHSN